MIVSRKLEDLVPSARNRAVQFIATCSAAGIDILITCTYRDGESQDALWNQGRTKPGAIVTNACAGESYHQYRCAFDIVPLVSGMPLWQVFDAAGTMLPVWSQIAQIAVDTDLQWAGHWKNFKEYCHLQYTGGLLIADLKIGKEIV